jgi:hypothetical protein
MASIVLGLATAHSPLLTLDGQEWHHRAAADRANPALNLSDGRFVTYDELLAEVGPRWEAVVTPEVLGRKAQACEAALDRLADELARAAPDVVVIVGDDQGELYGAANQPAFAIFHGPEAVMLDKVKDPALPAWLRTVRRGYLMDASHRLAVHDGLALELVQRLVDAGVDVSTSAEVPDPDKAGLGHAFGFVVKRLFRGRQIPIVPVLLNTYFPPNVPTAARCHDIGRLLARAIAQTPLDLKVAVVASGGLSHFVVDEALDREVMRAIQQRDAAALRAIPRCALNSGSSEILNWVTTAAAVEHLPVRFAEYHPLQRTPAGTGVGAAFVAWAP